MRMLLYICILALLPLAPAERLDVAKLEPVQTIAVRMTGELVEIETDTNNKGQGRTIQEAVADLEENTPGVIYLDTAQYLLLTEETVEYVPMLREYMHPSVRVSLWYGVGSVENAAKFLSVKEDLPKLRDWKPEQ